jgi:NhaP-type Na+/H+ or K+/H+ antiporter
VTYAAAVRAALGSVAVRALVRRLVALGVAVVLLATAFGFLVATLYLALAEVVEPALAALLTSLALGLVAGLILLVLRRRRPRRAAKRTIDTDALLLAATDEVRRDPWSSLATAAILGALSEILRSGSSSPPRP